jgi:hypothetical protein
MKRKKTPRSVASARHPQWKRRKILTDGNNTELSSEHIRNMLAGLSNIVQQNIMHPATLFRI